jgi:hypothetical protein
VFPTVGLWLSSRGASNVPPASGHQNPVVLDGEGRATLNSGMLLSSSSNTGVATHAAIPQRQPTREQSVGVSLLGDDR